MAVAGESRETGGGCGGALSVCRGGVELKVGCADVLGEKGGDVDVEGGEGSVGRKREVDCARE